LTRAALVAFASLAAGCSTDIKRLEQPQYSVTENTARAPLPPESIGRRNNAGVLDRTPQSWPDSGPRAPLPPPAATEPSPGRLAALPNSPPSLPPVAAGASRPFDAPKPAKPAIAPATGQTIEVQQGDTLYAISKRTGHPISAIMDVNQMKSAALKPGQKLVLPAGTPARRPLAKSDAAPTPATAPAVTAPPAATLPVAAAPPTDWNATYQVKQGDSLHAIARAHRIKVQDLQQANGITDPTKVRAGTMLKVPGTGAPGVAAAPPTLTPPPATEPPRVVQSPGAVTNGPRVINSLPATTTDAGVDAKPVQPGTKTAAAAPAAVASSGKFRWPVKGRVISAFGPRPDGTHNDGINISVPAGTEVLAAEGGTVAYAGSELKGYGNLVLVRHDNGFVSAYAHADELLVKRGDIVRRGQTIAKAGKTGTVDQPQVHFELRQGSKPVDPTPHLEKP
jgi:murein DD-endopeptidase MepM/ murein hydrolase activator NlpD